MTTEELIKQLNANGWTNSSLITEEKGQDYISICAPFNDEVMEIPVDATNWLNIKLDYFEARDGLTGAVREYVSSLVTQYLNTPISERKPEKKYRLEAVRHFSGPIAEKGYVKNVVCKTDYSGFEYSPVPFEFTEKQLETMKNNDPVLAPAIDAMKEEVKDDAC